MAAKNASLETELESNKGSTVSNKVLQEQISSSTNRFFEARVAVLGFKCRVMQLQGELDDARANRMAAPLPPPQQGSLQVKNTCVLCLYYIMHVVLDGHILPGLSNELYVPA